MSRPPRPAYESWPTRVVLDGLGEELIDPVVAEEPLEIRLAAGPRKEPAPLTVTMRTPGNDRELTLGLLYAEGIVQHAADVADMAVVSDPLRPLENRVDVWLTEGVDYDPRVTARSFLSTSACGVCGKAAIDGVFVSGSTTLPEGPIIPPALLLGLPDRMRDAQEIFAKTGSIHAAALFDAAGELIAVREDVGRHNAVDKIIGSRLLAEAVPTGEAILVSSGRVGFEIAQKALRAGIPVLAAVGAPSSLALRLADRGGMTVVGFLRDGRYNVYTAPQRIA